MGERILALRKQKGMSQEQLAEMLQVTRQTISKWESDKSIPDINLLIKLSKIFDISLDYLITGKEKKEIVVKKKDNKNKGYYVVGGFLILLGTIILLIMPTIASMYQAYIFDIFNTCYTDYEMYLREWPLLGMVWLGKLICFTGFFLLSVPFLKRIYLLRISMKGELL